MSTSAQCYSLEPIPGHIPYLYLDKKTRKEKGFALLSKERLEGENFELRELGKLTVEQMGNIKQLPKHVDKHKHQIRENDEMNNHLANDTEDESSDDDSSNFALKASRMSQSELVKELLFKFKGTCKGLKTMRNKKVKFGSRILEHNPPTTKRKKLLKSWEVGKQPRTCLKLPPDWEKLQDKPALLAEKMRFSQSLDENVEVNRNIDKLIKSLIQKTAARVKSVEISNTKVRIRKRVKKSRRPPPIQLPPNWQKTSQFSTELKASLEKQTGGKALIEVLSQLENFSSENGSNWGSKEDKHSLPIRLPHNWEELQAIPGQLAKKIKEVNDENSVSDVLIEKLNKAEHSLDNTYKKWGPSVAARPLQLPHNWEKLQCEPGQLVAKFKELNGENGVSGALLEKLEKKVEERVENRNGGLTDASFRSREPSFSQHHVRLPPDWEQLQSSPGKLADKIKEINGDKLVPAALIQNLKEKRPGDKNSLFTSSDSSRPFLLPLGWELLQSKPDQLVEKFKEVNGGQSVPAALLEKLENNIEQRPGARCSSSGTLSSSRPLQLPPDWEQLQCKPGQLAVKFKEFNSAKTVPAALLERLMESVQQRPEVPVRNGQSSELSGMERSARHVRLPSDWEQLQGNPDKLVEKIKRVNGEKFVPAALLEKLQKNDNKISSVVKSNRSPFDRPFQLPPNWEMLQDQPDKLAQKIREVNGEKSIPSALLVSLRRSKQRPEDRNELRTVINRRVLTQNSSSQSLARKIKSRLLRPTHDRRNLIHSQKIGRRGRSVPIVLPPDWESSPQDLVSQLRSNQMLNQTNLSKILACLETRPSVPQSRCSGSPVVLPENWSNLSDEELGKMLLNSKTSKREMIKVIEKLQQRNSKQDMYKSQERSSHSQERSRKRSRPSCGSKRKASQSNCQDRPAIKLPRNWETDPQLLEELLRKQNFNPQTVSKMIANINHKQTSSNKRQHSCVRTGEKKDSNQKMGDIQLPLGWDQVSSEQLASVMLAGQEMDGGGLKRVEGVIERLKKSREETSRKEEERHKRRRKEEHSKRREDLHKNSSAPGHRRRKDDIKKKIDSRKPASNVFEISAEERYRFLKPFKFGWRRECSIGVTGARLTPEGGYIKEKTRIDIYYWPPSSVASTPTLPATLNAKLKKLGARRIRKINGMKIFLEQNGVERKTGLTIENFSFKAKILDLGDFEFVRHNNDKHAKNIFQSEHLSDAEDYTQRDNLANAMLDSESLSDAEYQSKDALKVLDLFGDISDIEDDNNDKDGLKDSSTAEPKVLKNIRNESTKDDLEENPLSKTKPSTTKADESTKKSADEDEGRIKIVIESYELQKSLTCSVKPKKTIYKALAAFCAKCEMQMDKLQFWCGGRRVDQEEKGSNLEQDVITVTLVQKEDK